MFSVVDGNLLDAKEDFICHQTNCLSKGGAAGLAYYLFKEFPWADCYSDREEESIPGTIDVRYGPATDGYPPKAVVNMHSQYKPGGMEYRLDDGDGPQFPLGPCKDEPEKRLLYFRRCLFKMSNTLPRNASYAFPWQIGCGIAGGDWGEYVTVLKNFEEYIDGDVRLHRLRV